MVGNRNAANENSARLARLPRAPSRDKPGSLSCAAGRANNDAGDDTVNVVGTFDDLVKAPVKTDLRDLDITPGDEDKL